jgi:nickel-dependent lactate racemase
MIVSPGGYPKDINLYQAQKGLAHASLVTKQGGTILLAAACSEGTGSPSYERWVQQIKSVEELFDRFQREDFRVGPHKAFQIARDTARVNFFLISEMPAAFVRSLLINPAESLQIAVNSAVSTLPSSAHIGIMPHANGTIPFSLNRPSW